jgi:hypothetical protein
MGNFPTTSDNSCQIVIESFFVIRMPLMSKQIESLLTERAGYVARGLKDRVAAVEAELNALGFSHKFLTAPDVEVAAAELDIETAVVKRGRKPKVENGDS